jgi:hypothetical protein
MKRGLYRSNASWRRQGGKAQGEGVSSPEAKRKATRRKGLQKRNVEDWRKPLLLRQGGALRKAWFPYLCESMRTPYRVGVAGGKARGGGGGRRTQQRSQAGRKPPPRSGNDSARDEDCDTIPPGDGLPISSVQPSNAMICTGSSRKIAEDDVVGRRLGFTIGFE